MKKPQTEKPLTIRDLINHLIKLQAEFWVPWDTPIAYSSDDEWNSYKSCIYLPNMLYTKDKIKFWEYIEPIDGVEWNLFICIN